MKKCTTFTLGQTTIKKVFDDVADTSYLGEYGVKLKPGCIIRTLDKFYEDLEEDEEIPRTNDRSCEYFYPPENGEKIGTEEYKKYALQDYKMMEDLNNGQWAHIGIIVSTTVNTDMNVSSEISESLWGIEDHGNTDSREYHQTIIEDLKSSVKSQLLDMGFNESEIVESFNNSLEVKE